MPRIDAAFSDVEAQTVGGCAVGMIRDGEVVHRAGYGTVDGEGGSFSTRSLTQARSVSKQFTAFAIYLLEAEGELNLEDRAQQWLPELPSYEGSRPILVRDLLHHTSGLRTYDDLMALAGRTDYTVADALGMIVRQEGLNHPTGTEYSYTNSGYLLAAVLIERVSGQPLADFLNARVFAPLGMDDTRFAHHPPGGVGSFYRAEDGTMTVADETPQPLGATGLWTTVEDLMKWHRNFDTAVLGGRDLLRQYTLPGVLDDGEAGFYAGGLEIRQWDDRNLIVHEGGGGGYNAVFAHFPDQRLGISILCNFQPADVLTRFFDIARTTPLPAELTTAAAAPDVPQPAVPPLDPDDAASIAGTYYLQDGASIFEVMPYGEGLAVRISGSTPHALIPAGERYAVPGWGNGTFHLRFTAHADDRGRVATFMRDEPARQWPLRAARPLTAQQLSTWAGNYYSPSLDVTYTLAEREGLLAVRLADQPAQELLWEESTFDRPIYLGEGLFRIADDEVAFFADDADCELGFLLSVDRAKNIRFCRVSE